MSDKLHAIQGVYIGTTEAKIKKSGSTDFVVFHFIEGSQTAATFTQNAFCAAPVTLAKKHLKMTPPRALVINSGNANAGTGQQGLKDAELTCDLIAQHLQCDPSAVLPFSTGVIGENLPMDKVLQAIPSAISNLTIDSWLKGAEGIMTTDLVAKTFSKQIEIMGQVVTLTGFSKGSGMIHPNMATMLGFAATDARITQACLQQALSDAVDVSFNRITVDGDTSTNDACTLTATQQVDMPLIDSIDSEEYKAFAALVKEAMIDLAQKIVRDGEGATKFVSVIVEAAKDSAEALKVAQTVALSPLVKTALFASDPNWGRILAAVGRSGVEDFDIAKIEIYLGDVCIVRDGGRAMSYTEAAGQVVMNQTDIDIRINLARGTANETVWTTDFSYDYVKINAEYRT